MCKSEMRKCQIRKRPMIFASSRTRQQQLDALSFYCIWRRFLVCLFVCVCDDFFLSLFLSFYLGRLCLHIVFLFATFQISINEHTKRNNVVAVPSHARFCVALTLWSCIKSCCSRGSRCNAYRREQWWLESSISSHIVHLCYTVLTYIVRLNMQKVHANECSLYCMPAQPKNIHKCSMSVFCLLFIGWFAIGAFYKR